MLRVLCETGRWPCTGGGARAPAGQGADRGDTCIPCGTKVKPAGLALEVLRLITKLYWALHKLEFIKSFTYFVKYVYVAPDRKLFAFCR